MEPLEILSYDPVEQQRLIIDNILGDEVDLKNPTNPLVKLIEAVSVSTSGSLQEFAQSEKYTFVSLATNEQELYPHITNADEINLFASPAKTKVRIYIDLNSVVTSGIFEDETYKVTIPKHTTVETDGIVLTIPNDIKIYVSKKDDDYISFVEHDITETSLEFTNIGTVYSTITTMEDNTQWITFDVPVVQFDVSHIEATATLGLDFMLEVPITDQYYYSVIEYYDELSNSYIPLEKTYVESIYNPTIPTAFIQVLEDKLIYKIPKLYLDNIIKSNTLRVAVYTTKGKIRVPLKDYNTEDFKFTLYQDKDTLYKAAAFNLNYLVNSTNILDGGVNKRTVRDMRKKFVYRVTGNIELPITQYQLVENSRLDGFYIDKVEDTVSSRVYIASKDINDMSDVATPTYVYNISTKLSNMDDKQDTFLMDDELIVIKPLSIFKNMNGIVTPITKNERDFLDTLSLADKATYFNNNDFTYTPFLYIIDNNIDIITSRVYSVNKPNVDMLSIVNKNKYLKENVNITGYNIVREDDNYYIFLRLSGNAAYDLIKDKVSIQLTLDSMYGKRYFYSFVDGGISSKYLGVDEDIIHIIKIETDNLKIDNEEQMSLVYEQDKINEISLFSKSEIIIYYNGTDLSSYGGVQQLANSYVLSEEVPEVAEFIGLTRESMDVTIAEKINYFWNRVDNVYAIDKYKTYDTDIPKIYTEDVYEDNLIPFTPIDTDSDNICDFLELNIIHYKGDIVKDIEGNTIYEHKKGDVIFDEDGNPIIDVMNGLLRYVDILMMEYGYLESGKKIYKDHLDYTEDLILDWSLNKMTDLNLATLDNTKILFKARRTKNLVTSKTGMVYTRVLSPKVTLYYREDAQAFNLDIDTIYNGIGTVLNRYFSKPYIAISDIERDIESILDSSLLTADISDYLPDDPKIVDLEMFSNRFEIKKNINDIFDIQYDYTLDIKYI